jgi:hypothetical protein
MIDTDNPFTCKMTEEGFVVLATILLPHLSWSLYLVGAI